MVAISKGLLIVIGILAGIAVISILTIIVSVGIHLIGYHGSVWDDEDWNDYT